MKESQNEVIYLFSITGSLDICINKKSTIL